MGRWGIIATKSCNKPCRAAIVVVVRVGGLRTGGRLARTSPRPEDGEGRMGQVRRMTAEQVPEREQAPAQARGWVPGSTPGYVAPTYVLVAALCVLEGYCWLNVISAGSWRPSAMGSALVACAVTTGIWHFRTGRQVVGAVPVALGSVALVGLTGAAIVTRRPAAASLAGACDLLVAFLALGAVVATERWGGRAWSIPGRRHVGGAAPSGFSGRDRWRQTNGTPPCLRPRRGPAASTRTPPAGPARGLHLRVARSRRSPTRRPGPCRPRGR